MSIKSFIIGAATLASVAVPGVATAQGYYGGYYDGANRYDYDRRYDDRRYHDDRRYDARERREEWRHWREIERRRHWERRHNGGWRDGYYEGGERY